MFHKMCPVGCALAFAAAVCAATPEEDVRSAVAGIEQALQAPDPTAWVYHYTEDAEFVAPGEAVVRGRPALLDVARAMPPLRKVKITIERMEANAAMGYTFVRGSWVTGDDPAKQQTTRVRSLIIWRKESDGQWRITH
jgi:ketosteroid isomerase-like protein